MTCSDGADWSTIPFYAVGETTARALRALSQDLPRHLVPGPELILGASESGTSETLAHFIVDEYRRREDHGSLLELVGDKNKDTLRVILAEASIGTQQLQVYGTGPSASFAAHLARTVAEIPAGQLALTLAPVCPDACPQAM